jgi:DNA-binding NarL/FixJ family response regulator
MARILVVDDQAVYRTGLRGLICTQMLGAEVLEASSLPQALPEIQNGAFDLVLIGLDLSDAKTVDALKSAAREASPATRIAIISASDTRADILASLAAGLHGFISKHQSDAAILDAIARLLSGRIYVPRSLAEADDGEASASRGDNVGDSLPTEADLLKLTKRQREVLGLLALGMSNKEIARALEIAEATTKIHMAALLRALGVRNRTEAAYKAGQLLNSAKLAPPEDHGIKKNRRDLHGPQPLQDRRRQVGLVRVHGTGMR